VGRASHTTVCKSLFAYLLMRALPFVYRSKNFSNPVNYSYSLRNRYKPTVRSKNISSTALLDKNVLRIRVMVAFLHTLVVGKLMLRYGFIKLYTRCCYGDTSKKRGITECCCGDIVVMVYD
jgi:hypothetical protein